MTLSMLEYGSAIPSLEAADLTEILENYQDMTDIEAFLNLAAGADCE
jgi:hypothetical protein